MPGDLKRSAELRGRVIDTIDQAGIVEAVIIDVSTVRSIQFFLFVLQVHLFTLRLRGNHQGVAFAVYGDFTTEETTFKCRPDLRTARTP